MHPMTNWRSLSLVAVLIAILSACATPGDFCDVVAAPILFTPETSTRIVETDRPAAEAIRVQNDYWRRYCV